MEDLHATLKDLQSALQQLLKKYNNLKIENEELKNINAEISKILLQKEDAIKSSEEKLATNSISTLYNDEEKKSLQLKINTYLKDIEKCLALLNA